MSRKTQNIGEEAYPFIITSETYHPSKMQIFHCSCGEGILIVPDIKAMNTALKNHLTRHAGQHLTEEILIREMLKQIAIRYFQIMESQGQSFG